MGKQPSGSEAHQASNQGQQRRLGKKYGRDRKLSRPQSFHQSHFTTAFEDGRCHGGRNSQGRGKQRGQRD
jgi:hypothetical protein